MTFPDWQIVATITCIVLAALVVFRRLIALFSKTGASGCQTGGCSTCPSHQAGQKSPQAADFVSLESLVSSSSSMSERQTSKATSSGNGLPS